MSIAIIGDTHFGNNGFSKEVLDFQLEYFETKFFPHILKNKIKNVIHLGDLVDDRTKIDMFVLQNIKERFFQWFDDHGVTLHCIVGNHDMYFKHNMKYNFHTANLKEFSNVEIYTDPTTFHLDGYKFGIVPWKTNHDDYKFPSYKDVDILLGHFEMADVLMHSARMSKHGMDVNAFLKYKMVISGHYHAVSQKANIFYCGTQYQMSWNDFNDKKGFWELGEDYSLKMIENTISPKHLRLVYSEVEGKVEIISTGEGGHAREITITEASKLAKNNHIKLVLRKYKDDALFSSVFERISKETYDKVDVINEATAIEEIDEEEFHNKLEDTEAVSTIINNFIEMSTFSADIDKTELLEKFNELHAKALYKRTGQCF